MLLRVCAVCRRTGVCTDALHKSDKYCPEHCIRSLSIWIALENAILFASITTNLVITIGALLHTKIENVFGRHFDYHIFVSGPVSLVFTVPGILWQPPQEIVELIHQSHFFWICD
eukprot:TRINITY_DN7974_c0_g1_i5.p3 TRINITY_DN7974_c0_g1~~TRINITY_DN7974_c0_g1_i5.p3  ORF type:complete len:115 (+),score=15.59 TRINITY_DN7974_c0_g1_i5:395-739(+)